MKLLVSLLIISFSLQLLNGRVMKTGKKLNTN